MKEPEEELTAEELAEADESEVEIARGEWMEWEEASKLLRAEFLGE